DAVCPQVPRARAAGRRSLHLVVCQAINSYGKVTVCLLLPKTQQWSTEKVITATLQLKQSLIRHLFTYGPVPIEQADKVVMKETEIGPVPAHWDIDRFGNRVTTVSGQVDPKIEPYSKMLHIGPENIEEGTGRILNPK